MKKKSAKAVKETRLKIDSHSDSQAVNSDFTAVCIVLAAGSEIQANLRFNILQFFAICAFSAGVMNSLPKC